MITSRVTPPVKVEGAEVEKVVLAIVHATGKLLHLFQAHTIVVLTQLPLQALLRKSNYTAGLLNMELG